MPKRTEMIPMQEYMKMNPNERRDCFLRYDPRFLELETKLFEHGDTRLIYTPYMPHLTELLGRGLVQDAREFDIFPDSPKSACHATIARMKEIFGNRGTVYTGFALSGDGYWRRHSWFKLREAPIEPTPIPRVKYFGFHLSERESQKFVVQNIGKE